MQQGGEVEAAPDLAAAQGRGARGFRLSEKRQARGPGESVLSFSSNALPVSVGAQGVRRGACAVQGGRTQEDTTSLRPAGPRAPGPDGALFDTTLFQYKQSRKKVMSLWGRGLWEEWSVLLRSPTHNPWVGRPPTWQGKMAPKRAVWPSSQVKGLQLCRCLKLSVVGCCPGPRDTEGS